MKNCFKPEMELELEWKKQNNIHAKTVQRINKIGKNCIKAFASGKKTEDQECNIVYQLMNADACVRKSATIMLKSITPNTNSYKQLLDLIELPDNYNECKCHIKTLQKDNKKLKTEVTRNQKAIAIAYKNTNSAKRSLSEDKLLFKSNSGELPSETQNPKFELDVAEKKFKQKEEEYERIIKKLQADLLKQPNETVKTNENQLAFPSVQANNKEIIKLQSQIEDFRAQLSLSQTECKKLNCQVNNLQRELQDSKNKEDAYLNSYSYSKKQDEALKCQLTDDISKLNKLLEQYKGITTTQEKSIDDLRQQLDLQKSENIRSQQPQIENHETQLSVYLNRKLIEHRKQNQELEKQLLDQRSTYEAALSKSEDVCLQLKKQLQALKRISKNQPITIETEYYSSASKHEPSSEHQDVNKDPYVESALKAIAKVKAETDSLGKEIEEFSGTRKDRAFLHLQELLIRNIVKVDKVEAEGNLIIRQNRKEVLQYIQQLMQSLENKANQT